MMAHQKRPDRNNIICILDKTLVNVYTKIRDRQKRKTKNCKIDSKQKLKLTNNKLTAY